MAQQQQQGTSPTPAPTMTATAAFVGKRRALTSLRSLATSSAILFLVVLLSWAPQGTSGTSSSSTLWLCIGEAQACSFDEVCKECLSSWSPDNVDNCVTDFAEVQATSSGDCGTVGVETCCGFEAGTSGTCMENALMVEYWACIQSGNGCNLDDLPCYGADDDTAAATEEITAAGNGAAGTIASSGLLLAFVTSAAVAALVQG